MREKRLMEELYHYLGKSNLVLTSDQHGYRIKRKDNLNDNSVYVIGGFSTPDGKRLHIVLYDKGLINKVVGLLNEKDLVYSINYDYSPIDIYIYLNANKELLEIQAQPTKGNIQIIRGEYAVTNSADPNPILSTYGITSCVGLLLFDPKLKLGSVAHVDFPHEVSPTLRKMIEELDVFGANKLIFGRTPNIDPMTEQYGILSKYGKRFSEIIELPREFSFDTRTGEMKEYQDSYDPTLDRRLNEKTQHRLEELITMSFPIYISRIKPQS